METKFLNKNKIIIAAVVLVLLFAFGANLFRFATKKITLTVWGVDLSRSEFEALFGGKSVRVGRANVFFDYQEKSAEEYETALLNSFISSQSPDIFMASNEQLGNFKNLIYPLDLNTRSYNIASLNNDFPTIVEKELVFDNQLYLMPLSIDTLALYYNRNIFDSLSIPTGPKTWDDVRNLLPYLRKANSQNQLERAVISMGDSDTIKNSTDILSLVIYQLNGSILNDAKDRSVINEFVSFNNQRIDPGQTALSFYSSFYQPTNQNYSWSRSFGNDIDAFAQNKLAMFIGYFSDKAIIQKKNPNLSFAVSEMPQSAHNMGVNFGKISGLSVSKQSQNKDLAWALLLSVNNDFDWNNLFAIKKLPPARRSVISNLYSDADFGIFAKQALSAKSFFNPDHRKVKSLFNEAIDNANFSKDYKNASSKLSQNLTNLLRGY